VTAEIVRAGEYTRADLSRDRGAVEKADRTREAGLERSRAWHEVERLRDGAT
jgi:hypothetical protein